MWCGRRFSILAPHWILSLVFASENRLNGRSLGRRILDRSKTGKFGWLAGQMVVSFICHHSAPLYYTLQQSSAVHALNLIRFIFFAITFGWELFINSLCWLAERTGCCLSDWVCGESTVLPDAVVVVVIISPTSLPPSR